MADTPKRAWHHKNPYSERYSIPVIKESTYQQRLKVQKECEHISWQKVYTDNTHWRKVCDTCQKQFDSEVTETLHGKEVML